MGFGAHIKLKLSGMRKEQNFIIYPFSKGDDTVLIQSEKTIARIDLKTRAMVWNTRPGGAYGVHLAMPDARREEMSEVTLNEIKTLIHGQGNTINLAGANVMYADNSGAKSIFDL